MVSSFEVTVPPLRSGAKIGSFRAYFQAFCFIFFQYIPNSLSGWEILFGFWPRELQRVGKNGCPCSPNPGDVSTRFRGRLSMRVSEKGTLARKGLACVADESSATLPNLVARGHGGKDRTEYRIEGTQDTGKMEREGYRSAAHNKNDNI